MQPVPSHSPMLTEDAFRFAHVPCFQWGYDLFGIEASSSCPECGVAAIRSADPRRLVFADVRPLRRMRVGVRLWLIWLLMCVLSLPIGFLVLNTRLDALQYLWGCAAEIVACVSLWLIAWAIIRYSHGRARLGPLLFLCSSLVGACCTVATHPSAPWRHAGPDPSTLLLQARQSSQGASPSSFGTPLVAPLGRLGSCLEHVAGLCTVIWVFAFHLEMGKQMRRVPDQITSNVLFGVSAVVIALAGLAWLGGNDGWWIFFPLLFIGWAASVYGMYLVNRAISRIIMLEKRSQE
jgi:hypothetical protein